MAKKKAEKKVIPAELAERYKAALVARSLYDDTTEARRLDRAVAAALKEVETLSGPGTKRAVAQERWCIECRVAKDEVEEKKDQRRAANIPVLCQRLGLFIEERKREQYFDGEVETYTVAVDASGAVLLGSEDEWLQNEEIENFLEARADAG